VSASGVPVPPDYMSKWFTVGSELWLTQADALITALRDSLAAQRTEAADTGESAASPA